MDFSHNDDLHVWLVDLDGDAAVRAVQRGYLREQESARASRFVSSVHRRRFTAARSVLRDLLGQYCDLEPAHVPLRTLEHGKPALDLTLSPSPLTQTVEFNLSHSDRYALIAFSKDRPLGVDIEKHNDRVRADSIAASYLSDKEYEQMLALPDAERMRAFFRIWVLKEAFMKYSGLGMSLPLNKFSVDIQSPTQTRLLSVDAHFQRFAQCDLFDLTAPDGFSGAIAVQRSVSVAAPVSILQFTYSV